MGGGVVSDVLMLVDQIITKFVFSVFNQLDGPVAALWKIMFVAFIALYGYKVIFSGQFDARDLFTGIVRVVIIGIIATQWPAFSFAVYEIVSNGPDQIGAFLIEGTFAATNGIAPPGSEASANQALDTFYKNGMSASNLVATRGSGIAGKLLFGVYGLIILLGTLLLTGAAMLLIVISAFATAILLAVAPIFIILLMFGFTKPFFEGWMRQMLNYAIIPIFVYAVMALILRLMHGPMQGLLSNSTTKAQTIPFMGTFLLVALIGVVFLSQIFQVAAGIAGGFALSTANVASRASNWARKGGRAAMASRNLGKGMGNVSAYVRGAPGGSGQRGMKGVREVREQREAKYLEKSRPTQRRLRNASAGNRNDSYLPGGRAGNQTKGGTGGQNWNGKPPQAQQKSANPSGSGTKIS